MTIGVACPNPILQFWLNNGQLAAGGSVLTQIASTNAPTYQDSALLSPLPNPIPLNSRGEISNASGTSCQLFLPANTVYVFTLFDANGNQIWQAPYVNGVQSLLSQSIIGQTLYPQTAAEIAVGVTPTNYGYPADPYVDPRRYGADPTGVVISTVAVQAAINVALQASGTVWIGNNCNYLVGALTASIASPATSLRIIGSSPRGSVLTQSGTPSAVLTISGPTPTGNPVGAAVTLQDFSITLAGITTNGIQVNGLGGFTASRIWMTAGGAAGFNLNSALSCVIERCEVENAQYGIYARTDGAGSPPNLIIVRECTFGGNSFYAIDYDTGSELQVISCDIESNGTSATFTANPVATATSGTLTANWPNPTGTYACFFPDGETRSVTLTKGATTASWSGGLSNTQSAAWLGTPTGAIHIGSQINAFPTFGAAGIRLLNNWIEGNLGGYAIQVDAPSLGQSTWISIHGGHVVSSANGLAIHAAGSTDLSIDECFSVSTADVWNLTATYASLKNVNVTTLIDTGITYPTYINVSTSTQVQTCGRSTSFIGTLTTASGATGTILAIQQGKSVRLIFPTLDGGSTGTTASITGMPAAITPSTDRQLVAMLLDNNVQFIGGVTIGSSGVITLTKPGGTFTAANSKGIQGGTVGPYDL
jgi:hypothetical protein